MTGVWRLRAAVLTLVGALAVHQGRYGLAPREHDHDSAAAHTYLSWLTPVAAALVFVALIHLGARLCRLRTDAAPELPRARTLWLSATACLLAVFEAQEALETVFGHGHWPALDELVGHGGWVAVPLAVGVGGVLALLLKGAASVVGWALARSAPRRRRSLSGGRRPSLPVLAAPASVLARRLAGRAPPALS